MVPLISLVVPAYNEEAIIFHNLGAILDAAKGDGYDLELIAVDDGSRDATASEIARAAASDARIRLVSFTRNFGKEAAILAGLEHARGAAAVVLDGDLQHPPQLIPQMIAFWRQGLQVVEAVKQDRGNEAMRDSLFARGFYTLFRRFAGLDIDGHSDFKLLDRSVVDAYLSFPEKQRFFRGLIGWAGYPSAQIPFSVPERSDGGGSHWSKLKLLKYAINNITSFSSLPLKLVSWLGLATLAFGGIIGIISLLRKFEGKAIDGFTTVNLLIIVIGGAILISLGIIGHYIARLYDEVKGRPAYLVKLSKKDRS
ncbi:MAG TPA: glycosyltransferase family 2 protein [Paucimonas sp.]|nr:glycosyltransferase family 2 protein [Paucimonas sp.]